MILALGHLASDLQQGRPLHQLALWRNPFLWLLLHLSKVESEGKNPSVECQHRHCWSLQLLLMGAELADRTARLLLRGVAVKGCLHGNQHCLQGTPLLLLLLLLQGLVLMLLANAGHMHCLRHLDMPMVSTQERSWLL